MSTSSLRLLCVHGVGHHEADLASETSWRQAIEQSLSHWNVSGSVEVEFVAYDDLFAAAPLNALKVAEAMAKLTASGVVHGVGDFFSGLFGRQRALGGLSDTLRWTAGMVVQWTENEGLRRDCRQRVLEHTQRFQPDAVLAHSLGSLISYDTFARPENSGLLAGRRFVSFGSQIANPFVRGSLAFCGRVKPLDTARHWYHLFNKHDNAFTSPIRLHAPNFTQVDARFDDPGILDHEATSYLRHANTISTVWRDLAGAEPPGARALNGSPRTKDRKMAEVFSIAAKRPARRALLVGINDYPDPASRLEGCVNDVFLMSEVLQECGFEPENIRVVLNERATSNALLERLEWLLEGTRDEQDRVFYYSGHGAQLPGYGANEKVDRNDECLVTYDFDWKREHAVTDDQFYDLYSQLPYETRFLTIFDCCHSGGLARDGSLRARGLNPPDDIRHRLLKWNAREGMWERRQIDEPGRGLPEAQRERFFGPTGCKHKLGCASELRREMGPEFKQNCKKLGHHGPFMPVILKACAENEYAYEYRHGVTSHGAFTYALAQEFRARRKRKVSWHELVQAVALKLKRLGYEQRPDADGPRDILKQAIPWQAPVRSGPRK